MRNTKRILLLLSFCVAILIGSAQAAIIGTTNAAAFNSTNTIDWCRLGGCATNGTVAQSTFGGNQLWSSFGDVNSGFVDVTNLGAFPDNFLYNFVAGPDPSPAQAPPNLWISGFDTGMGVLYNGAVAPPNSGITPNTPSPFLLGFNEDQFAVGAYIESDFFGGFNATIEMFDSLGNSLGTYGPVLGNSSSEPGTALFVGAFSSTPIRFMTFSATGGGAVEPDFAIGTVRLGLGDLGSCAINDDFCTQVEDEIPEPASFLLLTPALLGLVAFTRRRRS